MNAVYLKITSWAGISIGAIHFYGELKARNPYRAIELKRTLTTASARRLTRQHGKAFQYLAGYQTIGFETEQEIIDLAIKTYKTHFPEATILILGDLIYAGPQKIIDGPKSIVKKVDGLIAKYREYENEKDYRMAENICNEWDKLIESV